MFFLKKYLATHVHQDDLVTVEDEVKRLKAFQSANDEEAERKRKDILTMARQERLKANGDRSSDDEISITRSRPINKEPDDIDNDDDDDDDFSMRTTQKRTQSSSSAAATARSATASSRGRGRGRGRAKATATITPRGKRKPF